MHTIVHRIRAGTELDLSLTEGSELFCRQGALRLTATPQGWADGGLPATGLPATIVLATGQGWRAGSDLRLRVSAPSAACLELQAAPIRPDHPTPQAIWPAAQALAGWLRSLRRGRHAA